MTENGMDAPGSSEVTTATVTLVYPDGTEMRKTITKVDRELTPSEIRFLALYERAYRFQSESLGFLGRFGYFCSGPHLGHDRLVRVHELKCLVLMPSGFVGLFTLPFFGVRMVMLASGGWGKFWKGLPTFVLQLSLLAAVGFLFGVLGAWSVNHERHASEGKGIPESEDAKFCRVVGEVSQHGCVT